MTEEEIIAIPPPPVSEDGESHEIMLKAYIRGVVDVIRLQNPQFTSLEVEAVVLDSLQRLAKLIGETKNARTQQGY